MDEIIFNNDFQLERARIDSLKWVVDTESLGTSRLDSDVTAYATDDDIEILKVPYWEFLASEDVEDGDTKENEENVRIGFVCGYFERGSAELLNHIWDDEPTDVEWTVVSPGS